jgi:hypothetical protein
MEVNITGYRMGTDLARMPEDIDMAMSLSRETCRLMASEHGSVDTFLDRIGIAEKRPPIVAWDLAAAKGRGPERDRV